MDERTMLEQIRRSAEEIEIPEALKPETIEKKLKEEQTKNTVTATDRLRKENSRNKNNRPNWSRYACWGGRIAAALALCICAGAVFAVADGSRFGYVKDIGKLPADSAENPGTEQAVCEETKERTLGDMYYLAEDYGNVYDMLPRWGQEQSWSESADEERYNNTSNGAAEGDSVSDKTESSASDLDSELSYDEGGYSTTNVQTVGVDESDIVKTDGNYIYTLRDNKVVITDIRNNALTETGTIAPPMKSASDMVCEMYVDGDKLILVMERNVSAFKAGGEGAPGALEGSAERSVMYTDAIYDMDAKYETCILTYDIRNRSKAVFLGEMAQDGAYVSSRKIEDKIYLFTNYWMEDMSLSRRAALTTGGLEKWLPSVADKVVNADCIYLPNRGQNGLVMASMDVDEPDTAIDSKLIVNNGAEIYVSTEAVYLYSTEYADRVITTIAKFELQDNGIIHAVNAGTVNGYITDTFGINEADGYLRVLTTGWNGNMDTNRLTIFGENMEYISAVNDIAPGEQIYAARFLEDVGYFVTYRNTDPLFTVDLSNHYEPKIIGELKVSGFSEYLHLWDETNLIGIGYETDPQTGERKGVKLSMFDISDPVNVKEEARYVMQNEDNCSAMWNYKSVLISKEKNLIGFVTEDFDGEGEISYRAFSYENGTFTEQLTVGGLQKNMGTWYAMQDCRSLYCGHMLYLIGADVITSYDMDNGYEQKKQS